VKRKQVSGIRERERIKKERWKERMNEEKQGCVSKGCATESPSFGGVWGGHLPNRNTERTSVRRNRSSIETLQLITQYFNASIMQHD
jgi:hypothetical protein